MNAIASHLLTGAAILAVAAICYGPLIAEWMR